MKKKITYITLIYFIWFLSSEITLKNGLIPIAFDLLIILLISNIILITINKLVRIKVLRKNIHVIIDSFKILIISLLLILLTMFVQHNISQKRAKVVLKSLQNYYEKNNALPSSLDSLDCNIKTGYGITETYIYLPEIGSTSFYFGLNTHFGSWTKGLNIKEVDEYFYND